MERILKFCVCTLFLSITAIMVFAVFMAMREGLSHG